MYEGVKEMNTDKYPTFRSKPIRALRLNLDQNPIISGIVLPKPTNTPWYPKLDKTWPTSFISHSLVIGY